MLSKTPIADRARGRWRDILLSLGVSPLVLNGKAQPCPFCGGKDRFTWDDKGGSGAFVCRGCGAGDGVTFTERFLKCDFRAAAEAIEKHIPTAHVRAPKAYQGEETQKSAMRALWRQGRPLDGNDLASRYLKARGLELPSWPSALRFVADLPYHYPNDPKTVTRLPAMIANFRAPDDASGIIHRSYLREPGARADIEKPTMMMPGRVPEGGAVRLGPIAETLGVGEGIENALSAAALFSITVWATCSVWNLIKWIPPAECKNVIIFGDLDKSFAGQNGAYSLAYKLKNMWANKEKTERYNVNVVFTQFRDDGMFGEDFNDALQNGK